MIELHQNQHFIIVDGHVHLHDCFELGSLLDSALKNFQSVIEQRGLSNNFSLALLLTEMGKQDCFAKCWSYLQQEDQLNTKNSKSIWEFYRTKEDLSLYAVNQDGQGIFLIAGRQIVTEEGLEVLALVTNEAFEEKLSLNESIKAILSKGGIPVMPWGVGKWIGQRGRTLADYLEKNSDLTLFLGDNSGRPNFWPFPSTFNTKQQKFPILPGTDPLPIKSEVWRPGSYGFTIQGAALNTSEPGEQIKEALLTAANSIQPYGNLETLPRFLKNQLLIRLT